MKEFDWTRELGERFSTIHLICSVGRLQRRMSVSSNDQRETPILKVLKLSQSFKMLPCFAQELEELLLGNENFVGSLPEKQIIDARKDKVLDIKVFIPFRISKKTIAQCKNMEKKSVKEILATLEPKQTSTKLFFFTEPEVQDESEFFVAERDSEGSTVNQYYNNWRSRSMNLEQTKFYEFHIEVQEINLEKVVFLDIKDITFVVSQQIKNSEETFQQAIEKNYSHEQMTPLNCILTLSRWIERNLAQSLML